MNKIKTFIKVYSKTLILIGAVILGGVVGAIWGEGASVLKPFGTLFLNMIQAVVVSLVFLTVTTSIGSIKTSGKVGKLIATIVIVVIVMSVLTVTFAYIATRVQLIDPAYSQKLIEGYEGTVESAPENISFLESIVNMLSTNDFSNLLSKNNMLALLVMAVLTGIAIQTTMPKSQKLVEVLESASEVVERLIQLIMYYAPIGLGCYFADFVGEFGVGIADGYLKAIVVYTIAVLIIYFVFYSIIVFAASGLRGLKLYWRKIIVPSVTAVSTMSSIASIPSSINAAIDMGVPKEVADTTIPLGISFHKEGSLVINVFTLAFAAALFGKDVPLSMMLYVSIFTTLLIAGIPSGAGEASLILRLTLIGCPAAAFPILIVLTQITDVLQTLLNVTGNNVAAVVVNRIMNGKTPEKTESLENELTNR